MNERLRSLTMTTTITTTTTANYGVKLYRLELGCVCDGKFAFHFGCGSSAVNCCLLWDVRMELHVGSLSAHLRLGGEDFGLLL